MTTPSEALARDLQALREAIGRVSDSRLKAHMQNALEGFDMRDEASTATPSTQQQSDDSNDSIVVTLRTKDVTTKAPRDALFLAVHAILLETGFEVADAPGGEAFPLSADWDANSSTGLFAGKYKHKNDRSIPFTLQGLFVGNKFEVYLSDDKNHTHSIELSTDNFVSLSAASSNAADVLQDLSALRQKLTPFLENLAPKEKPTATATGASSVRRPPPSSDDRGYESGGSPYVFPPTGSGDILPPAFGGGEPSTEIGPNHPIFGQRYDPTRGPVPGARFDPYGPLSADPQGPPRGFIGGPHPFRPGPAPGHPFGEPNPDHLRMPRDDGYDDPFGMGGGGRRGRPGPGPGPGRGGGFGSDFPQPFGSDHSFF
ncbi:hypothetical protein Poli38472_005499 [Pythium oligandrum]|uniref:PI31 proteasome regulator N-terminal domain-containing protein n=1 Tax=Pythium oligandrum TaxID=41045 RepID=A0A8K1FHL9_PYTOL|nr:hypothetical protein Poli38472_005499 [Pythium oligandrum]|eukprot:TMW62881.1 hypothetical protein Poli38472_005499 [Pythium oligandrum]